MTHHQDDTPAATEVLTPATSTAQPGQSPRPARRRLATLGGVALALVALGGAAGFTLARATTEPPAQVSPAAAPAPNGAPRQNNQDDAPDRGLPDTPEGSGGFGGWDDMPQPPSWGGPQDGRRPLDQRGPVTGQDDSDATDTQSIGIVEITSTLTQGDSSGTGLVLTGDGTIVTNHHVIEGATSIEVRVVSTGDTYTATYLGADATADVAVLMLDDAQGLATVDLATQSAAVDDDVVAVGDAGGDGGSLTASPGTITALDQRITVSDLQGGSSRLTGLIETNAALEGGDSGGALLNDNGQVIGMNVAASTNTRNTQGYAIPVNTIQDTVDAITSGTTSPSIDLGYHAYLGIALDPQSSAPVVAAVIDGEAAQNVGIQAGDTITTLNGKQVKTVKRLQATLADLAPGSRARIGWATSDGTARQATVTLGQAPIS